MLLTETKKEKTIKKSNTIQVFILKPKKLNLEILSKPLEEWVSFAVEKYPYQILEYNGEKINDFIKPYLNQLDYTIILSATTPLIQEQTVDLIVDYITLKQSKATKLSVGYAFLNEYLENTEEIFYDSLFTQSEDEFYVVENKRQLNVAKKVIIERINSFHLDNGVEIINPKTVTIEPDVFIGENVTIYPNNVLKGNTKIGDNVVLKENNVIENSIIEKGCCVINSKLEDCVIKEQSYIMPYCYLHNKTQIGAFCTIKSYCEIEETVVKDNEILESFTKLKNGEKIE